MADYLFIQYGQEDEAGGLNVRTTPDEFRVLLQKYIDEARERRMKPILLTPVSRAVFDGSGQLVPSALEPYTAVMRELASGRSLPIVDLHALLDSQYEKRGSHEAARYCAQADLALLNDKGVEHIAGLLVAALLKNAPELAPIFGRDPTQLGMLTLPGMPELPELPKIPSQ